METTWLILVVSVLAFFAGYGIRALFNDLKKAGWFR